MSDLLELAVNLPGLPLTTRMYRMGECSIIVGREPGHNPFGELRWHLSVAHQARYPTWDEMYEARYEHGLVPLDLTMAMLLPRPEEYVNVHENCFHLWEIEDR